MNKPPRKLLKDDAVPTLFDYNNYKQSNKRRSSLNREEASSKKQLCDDAFVHYDKWRDLEVQMNSKDIQASPEMKNAATQTELTAEPTQPQFTTEAQYEVDQLFDIESTSDCSDSDNSDNTFVASGDEYDTDQEFNDSNHNVKNSAFIVFWTSLCTLFVNCFTCFAKTTKIVKNVRGSLLNVKTYCINGHCYTWYSQPFINRYACGNIKLSASVLFSANTFAKIAEYFRLADIKWIGKTSYYRLQKEYLHGVVNEAFKKENDAILSKLKENGPCEVSGDGRCDSPGHNAKYLTYTMLDQATNLIIGMSLTQVTEAGNSNAMEKMGFIKVLSGLKKIGVAIKQITTDRHKQIRKYIREEEKDIKQQFDVWHFCKNIRKKLTAAAKKKSCSELSGWIKSICNHLWWAAATCEGDVTMLREKWTSILFHVQNKHRWTSCSKFHKCAHARLKKKDARKKAWLHPNSDAFKALQDIVLDKNLLKDLEHLTNFSHTGTLEVFHALYNRWIPKSQHFSYLGMVTRGQLAALDFNSGSNLKQATTSEGKKKYNIGFSKVTQLWSAKPIKEKKDRSFLSKLVERTLEVIKEEIVLELPKVPESLPKNIAPIQKPDKNEVISKQISRFS